MSSYGVETARILAAFPHDTAENQPPCTVLRPTRTKHTGNLHLSSSVYQAPNWAALLRHPKRGTSCPFRAASGTVSLGPLVAKPGQLQPETGTEREQRHKDSTQARRDPFLNRWRHGSHARHFLLAAPPFAASSLQQPQETSTHSIQQGSKLALNLGKLRRPPPTRP